MKKVLVSGAGGFVGARIMTQLADRYELCSFPKGMLAAANEQQYRSISAEHSPM